MDPTYRWFLSSRFNGLVCVLFGPYSVQANEHSNSQPEKLGNGDPNCNTFHLLSGLYSIIHCNENDASRPLHMVELHVLAISLVDRQ